MTQENKELLLKDFCEKLLYNTRVSLKYENKHLEGTLIAVYPTEDDRVIIDDLSEAIAYYDVRCGGFHIEENNIKPYLFPLSSMTEEQKQELTNLAEETVFQILHSEDGNPQPQIAVDWYNKNHFDYRGLIEKGLAIDATGLNIY